MIVTIPVGEVGIRIRRMIPKARRKVTKNDKIISIRIFMILEHICAKILCVFFYG